MWGGRYFSSVCMSLKGLAPRAGLEPATFRLTAERSTIELPGNIPIFFCLRGGCKPDAGDMGDMIEPKSRIFNTSFPRIQTSHDLDVRLFRHLSCRDRAKSLLEIRESVACPSVCSGTVASRAMQRRSLRDTSPCACRSFRASVQPSAAPPFQERGEANRG